MSYVEERGENPRFPCGGEGRPLIQLALDFFVPFPAEYLFLPLEGLDQAPDDPMGARRFVARIGLDPSPPVAAPQLFRPMRLHPRRQRVIRPDAICLLARRMDDETMRRDLIAAIVVALVNDRFAARFVHP